MTIPNSTERIIIFSPHPDDDILAAGGLLQQIAIKNDAVRIIFLTDGDNNPWPQRVMERRWHISAEDRIRWGQRRRKEALNGLKHLDIDSENIAFLGLPDQGLTDLLLKGDENVLCRIAMEIEAWKPSIIISPSAFDLHPDHSSFAVLLKHALWNLESEGRVISKPQLLYFSVHQNVTPPGEKVCISLTDRQVEQKRIALMAHESQMLLSKKRFLSYVRDREYFYREEDLFDNHPVKTAFVQDGLLNIVLHNLTFADWLKQPLLHIVAGKESPICLNLRISLLNRSHIEIFNADNLLVSKNGRIISFGKSVVVKLRHLLIYNAQDLFVKLDNKWGFFDRAGWKSLTVQVIKSENELLRPYAKTVVLIPCYNVVGLCGDVIMKATKLSDQVIVIDDGSTDGTRQVVENIIAHGKGNLHLIRKNVNEGKGSALIDGMWFALSHFKFEALITMDGDGQHRPEDIAKAIKAINANKDFVIGSRNFSTMPLRSRFGNTVTSRLLQMLYGNSPSDTQSGFRAFSPSFARQVVSLIEKGRYETELFTLLLALDTPISIGTFNIDTIYLDKNKSSHFRPMADSARILLSLLRWQISKLNVINAIF